MPELTIVAIPCRDDYVWRLSSEKVPHLTLMYLGEVDEEDTDQIEDFLEHVVDTTMCPFGLEVDHRGELGPKNADVLFFKEYCVETLEEVRSYFMTDEHVFRAYNATEQFDGWIPHLTMGYPESPAREDTREYPGTRWVNFDTVALWTEDYSGYEYRLDYPYEGQVYMSDDTDGLTHYGIRGMKWGIRRSKKQLDASTDHQVAETARAKARKGGVKTLSNAELKTLVDRMNLEQQYARVVPPSTGAKFTRAGGKFAGEVLVNVGKQQATKIVNDQATRLVASAFKK
jgi:2'-5' RNA ligase